MISRNAHRSHWLNTARRWAALLALLLMAWTGVSTARPVSAEGTRELSANGGRRALTEWRANTTAGLYRRTFLRVYARAGESIYLGSSAVGVNSGDIVLYSEGKIPDSQVNARYLDPSQPAYYITPDFMCSAYRLTHPGAGVLDTRAKELAGPLPNAGGYNPCVYVAPTSGTYWVAMFGPDGPNGTTDGTAGTIDAPVVNANQRSGVSMWDITVRDGGGATKPSRVFVDYLAQITSGNGATYRVMSTVYAVTDDGFIYQIDFNGLDPYGYIFYGNRVGFLDPDGETPLYHDIVTDNNQLDGPLGGATLAPASAKLFFSDPRLSGDLPRSVLPTPIPPDISNVSFSGSAGGLDGYFSIGGQFTYTGNIGGISEIVIQGPTSSDFDPENPRNRTLHSQSVVGANVIDWDGKDNEGIPFPVRADYPFQIIFHAGEYHFPLLDVENSQLGGPTFTLLNPLGGVCPLATCRQAFYDDRGYVLSNGAVVGTPGAVLTYPNGLVPPTTDHSDLSDGFDTATSQRAFGDGSGDGFGNYKGLDLWTYYPLWPVEGTLNVVPQVDLDLNIIKSHTGTFRIGNYGDSFEIDVRNVGLSTINGAITMNDSLPAGLTPISATTPGGSGWNACAISGQDVSCVHPNAAGLASGASLPPITISVYVSPFAAPFATNTAYVLNDYDSNTSNNSYTDTVTIESVDIAVQKSVSPTNTPLEGDTVTFTVTAGNAGPGGADSIQIGDVLPAGLTYVSHHESQGSYSSATGAWNVGALPAGQSATLTLTATVDAATQGASLTNTAALQSSIPYDYNSANDSASSTLDVLATTLRGVVTDNLGQPIASAAVTVTDSAGTRYTVITGADGSYEVVGLAAGDATVSAYAGGYQPSGSIIKTIVAATVNTQDIILQRVADLELAKTDSRPAVGPDTDTIYTITVTNHGAATAQGVQITDPLGPALGVHDPNLALVSLRRASDGVAAPYTIDGSGNIVWTAPDLAPGESIAYLLTAHVSAGASGSVTNYAAASTTTTEPDLTNNQQSDIDLVQALPDLMVTLDDGRITVQPGESLLYTVEYANIGSANASAAVVTVRIPAGLTGITPNNGGVYNPGTGLITWNLGALAAGDSGSLTFGATVGATTAPGAVLAAGAEIYYGAHGPEIDLANNQASDSDIVARPFLVLQKSTGVAAEVGVPLTFTIAYSNPSALAAQNVTITDYLPAGTSYYGGCYPPSCSISASRLTWRIASVPPGGSGSVSFQVVPGLSAGGGLLAGPTLAATGSGDSLRVTSRALDADLIAQWTGSGATGAADWNANPRISAFDPTGWSAALAPTTIEPGWLPASALSAEWVTASTAAQAEPNYSFYRQSFCAPLNAGRLSGALQIASDDTATLYLNGVPVGEHTGSGGAGMLDLGDALQPGANLLAARLLNNTHGGHPLYSGADHPGLLYSAMVSWESLQPFATANTLLVSGQAATFAIAPGAIAGVGALEYRYDFGEGAPLDYSTSTSATHTYGTPGTYTATVTARDASGCAPAEQTFTITVLPAATSNLILNSATAAYRGSVTGVSYSVTSGTGADMPTLLADLSIAKTSTPTSAIPGQTITYTITATNAGPTTLTSINVVDDFPEGVFPVIYTPSSGVYDQSTGEWTGISLPPSGSVTLDISCSLSMYASGTLTNTAYVSTSEASDPDLSDNIATDENDLLANVDIGVTVTASPTTYIPNTPETFTFTVTNNGPIGLTSINLVPQIPAQLSGATFTYTASSGAYDPNTNVWSGLTLAPGQSITLTAATTIPAGATGTITYGGTVSPNGATDTNAANNTATVSITRNATLYDIGDRVWVDNNGNGILDGGETGLNNVTVRLYRASDNALIGTDTTGNSGGTPGWYSFDNLLGDVYYLVFTPPATYYLAPQDRGTNDAADSDPDPATGRTANFTLNANLTNMDAGMFRRATVGDYIWRDTDGDGYRDGGDTNGLGGVTVQLINCGIDLTCGNADDLPPVSTISTTTTTITTNYSFTTDPGTYYIHVIAPDGYSFGPQAQGGDATRDSNVDPLTGNTGAFTLTSNESDLTIDVSLVAGATVGDRVWVDSDADGIQDSGEATYAGATVTLVYCGADGVCENGDDSNYRTTTSTASGYVFTNVATGTRRYYVRFTLPGGYTFSPQSQGSDTTLDSDPNQTSGRTNGFTLTPGETRLDLDAGIYQRVTLGSLVWVDTNANGIQNEGSNGPTGMTVRLMTCGADGVCGNGDDAVSQTTTTAAGGAYSFSADPGTYYIQFVPPAGYTFTAQSAPGSTATNDSNPNPGTGNTASFTLVSGQAADNSIDAGLLQNRSTIGDFVWRDDNANGIQEAGEPGISGVTVTLYTTAGAIVQVTTTNSAGQYAFTNLTAGSYYVQYTLPGATYRFTTRSAPGSTPANDSDADPATGRTATITVTTTAASYNTYDAGMYQRGSIGDRVWTDSNANGIQEAGEPGLAGVTVSLYTAGGALQASTTSAADGSYAFADVPAGSYYLVFTAPGSAYSFSPALRGGDAARDSNAVEVTPTTDPPTGQTAAFTLTADQAITSIDAGLYQRVTIGDFVWYDANGNGLQDGGETGISGVTVELRQAGSNALAASTTTGADGSYGFSLSPGSYYVRFILPGGYVFSPRGEGSDATIDSDADVSSGQTGAFTMTSGQSNLHLDAGMLDNRASIGDFAWSDRNGNGIQDAGETGVAGVYVELYAADGTLVDATTSDSAGRYAFSNVTPGDYYLVFYTPGGYSFGPQGRGSDPAQDSDANPVTGQTDMFSVVAGQNQPAMDAALVQNRAVIGDRVWDDANGDGIQDGGEAGLAGATVRLYTAAGALVGTTTTDSTGQYAFTNVTPGSYYVAFTPPAGYSFSLPAQGSDPDADSDADPFTGRTAVFPVVSGETNSSVDAALAYGRASVGNLVWNDLNGDGIQDAGEQGLRGVTVNLYTAAGDLVGTTTSGTGGQYAFANLAPGDYRLQVVLPAGYQFGPRNQGGDPTRDSDFDPADGFSAVFTLSAAQMNAAMDAGLGAIPTSVNVGNLVATPGPDGVTLTWQSTLEDTILGYNILRQDFGAYGYTQLNPAMVPAQHSGDSFGADYTWLDDTANPEGSYYYWLEVVNVYGSEMVGPVGVNIPNYPVFLPLIVQ